MEDFEKEFLHEGIVNGFESLMPDEIMVIFYSWKDKQGERQRKSVYGNNTDDFLYNLENITRD